MPSVVWGVVLISIETMNIVICILWCVQWGQLSLNSLWGLIMRVIDLDESSSCNDLLSQFGILSKGQLSYPTDMQVYQWYCCRSTLTFSRVDLHLIIEVPILWKEISDARNCVAVIKWRWSSSALINWKPDICHRRPCIWNSVYFKLFLHNFLRFSLSKHTYFHYGDTLSFIPDGMFTVTKTTINSVTILFTPQDIMHGTQKLVVNGEWIINQTKSSEANHGIVHSAWS